MKKLIIITVLHIGCGYKSPTNNAKQMLFTKAEILSSLDEVGKNPYNIFPDLEHPYVYPIVNRIHLFADSNNWAIVFELCGYNNRSNTLSTQLVYFGNDLINLDREGENGKFLSNEKIEDLVSENELMDVSDEDLKINADVNEIAINGHIVPVERRREEYERLHIKIENGEVDLISLFRYANEADPSVFYLKDSIIAQSIREPLPKIMTINAWHYEPFAFANGTMHGSKPSSYETFNLIADVLVMRDKSLYQPKSEPNNHWKFWPNAGMF